MGPLECHSAPRTHLRSPHIKSHPNICSIYSVENIPITRLYSDQAKPLGTLQNTKFTTRHLPWVLQYAHVPKNTTSKNLILKNKNPHRKRVEPGSQDIRPFTSLIYIQKPKNDFKRKTSIEKNNQNKKKS